MLPFFSKNNLLLLASAILYPIIFINNLSLLAWVCLVPLIYSISNQDKKSFFKLGLFYGGSLCIASFYWLPKTISIFMNEGSSFWGRLLSFVAVLIGALFFGCILFFYSLLKRNSYPSWINAMLLATVWALCEQLFAFIFDGMPWLGFQMGNLLLGNLYFIQIAEWGGLYLLSFMVVFINGWLGLLLAKSLVKQLWKPIAFFSCYLGICFLLLQHRSEENKDLSTTISIALMCANSSPERNWDDNNGPQMVRNLLRLNKEACMLKPDIVLWTESAVPWTYMPDDPLVLEVLKNAKATNTIQIMGINSMNDSNSVYNSAYCIMPDGTVAGRYDKRFLLNIAEKPLSIFGFPILNSAVGSYVQKGKFTTPFPTSKGKIGVLICNEALIPAAAIDMVNNDADYLINISNDGWFSETPFLSHFHFNNARLRAVEVRRDIAVNSNLGISGKISASGVIVSSNESESAYIEKVSLNQHNSRTLFSQYPYFFLFALSLIIITFITIKVLIHIKH